MAFLSTLPFSGKLIIAIIIFLFLLAIGLLLMLKNRYKVLLEDINTLYSNPDGRYVPDNSAIKMAIKRYKMGYYESGSDVNTQAIVDSAVEAELKGAALIERFLKNVVSLLITLGLLGTFIGLTMSVGDLASMFDVGGSTDVLATLEIVGSGLLSSLSGMGVAFTTSLVGIACSILYTLINIVISPLQKKEQFIVSLEDYLDNILAPRLNTSRPDDNAELLKMLDQAMTRHSNAIAETLGESSKSLNETAVWLNEVMKNFGSTCHTFNDNVRDFSEFNHHLRNNIERMDVNFIRLVEVLRDKSDNIARRD